MRKEGIKIYYNHKNNCIVAEAPGSLDNTVDYVKTIEKKCPDNLEETDIYIAVALIFMKDYFGSNSEFRRWVDSHFVGKKPEEYIEKKPAVQKVEERTLEQAIDEEQKYKAGQRVLFTASEGTREIIGDVLDYDFDTHTYTIQWNDKTFRVLPMRIIRKCRAANKGKNNEENS